MLPSPFFTAQGDCDGNGQTDISVWRTTNATIYLLRSTDGGFGAAPWGLTGDYPVANFNSH